MIKSKNKISYNNEGSAIITALVVSTVLMVLCLSLLAIAYSLFLSQKNSSSDLPEREMLYSAVELFEEGILGAKYSPDGIAVYDDSDTADTSLKNFGELLLTEIWNGFEGPDVNGRYYQPDTSDEWLYYDINASGAHANLDYKPGVNKICSKFFNLTSIGSNKIIAQMYWTLPDGWDGNIDNKAGTKLHAIYTLYNNDMVEVVQTERVYKLDQYLVTETSTSNSQTSNNTPKEYKIEFKNSTSGQTANAYFLPDPIYFDDLNAVPSSINQKVETSWYFDGNCKNIYVFGSPLTEDKFKTINGQKTLTLYTNWDGHKPLLISFIVGKKIVYKGFYRHNTEDYLSVTDYPLTQQILDDIKAKDPSDLNKDESILNFVGWMWKNGSMEEFFRSSGIYSGKSKAVNTDVNVYAIFDTYRKGNGQVPPGQVPGFSNANNLVDLYDENIVVTSSIVYHWSRLIE